MPRGGQWTGFREPVPLYQGHMAAGRVVGAVFFWTMSAFAARLVKSNPTGDLSGPAQRSCGRSISSSLINDCRKTTNAIALTN